MFQKTGLLALLSAILCMAAVPSVSDAQIHWNGSYDGIWSAGSNWFGGVTPGAGDTVTIDAQDTNQPDYWVTLDLNNWEVDFLTLSTSTGGFRMSGKNFTTVNGANMASGRTSMINSIWHTNGTISNGGDFQLFATAANNSNTIDGNFSNSGTLNFLTAARTSSFTVSEMANSGLISFRNNSGGASVLNVNNSGSFVNSGTIKSFSASIGSAGSSYIRANGFTNIGQVVNESGATMAFDRSGAVLVNSNIFAGTNGGFSFSNFSSFENQSPANLQGTSLAFTGQGSGTSTMTNAGLIHALSGTLTIQNTTLNNSGTISGAGGTSLNLSGVNYNHFGGGLSGFDAIALSNTTANLTAGWNPSSSNTTFSNTTINGPAAFTNNFGSTLNLAESTFNAPVINYGMIQQEGINSLRSNAMNGGLTNNAGAEILIKSTNTTAGHRNSKLNVDGNIDNHGTLAFQSRRYNTGYQGDSFLEQTNGTLTNYSSGTIQTRAPAAGTPGVNYINTDTLINNGSIENNNLSALLFDRDGASYTNSGQIDSIGSYIQFNDIGSLNNTIGGNITGSQLYVYGISNSSGAFDNAGMISLTTGGLTFLDLATINNSGTMNIAGGNVAVSNYGTFTNSGAIQSGATREISFSGGTYNHNAGATMAGGDLLSFNNATLNLNTMFSTDFPIVNLTNTTINGPAAFTNNTGSTLTLVESTINAPVINYGMIQQEGINTNRVNAMNGGLTNNAGAEILIKSTVTSPGHRTSKLNVDGNIDNHGTLAFQSRRYSSGYQGDAYLVQTNGMLTNHANGLIQTRDPAAGTPGVNYINTDTLINNGSIENNNLSALLFDRDGASYTNSGQIDSIGSYIQFNDIGSLNNTVGGNITGSQLYVYGISNSSGAFDNAGTISLTTGGLTFLDLATINNSGTMNIAGGNVAVSNYGTFTNSGAIQSGATREISFSGGTYNHNAGATMAGGDLLSFNNATLNLNTMFSTDFPTVNLTNTTTNGPAAFTNNTGSTLTLVESTFNAPVINYGMIQQEGINTNRVNAMNGGLTNNAGAEILIKSTVTSPGHRTSKLNVDGNIDNHGTLAFQSRRYSSGYQGDAYLVQTNGMLTNHANGLIQTRDPAAGTPGVNYINTDTLINNGTIENNNPSALAFDRDGASYTNNGLIDSIGSHIQFNDIGSLNNTVGGNITGSQLYVYGISNSSGAFDNAGTISLTTGGLTFLDLATINNSGTMNIAGGNVAVSNYGAFTNSGAIQSGATREISFSGGTYNHNAGATMAGGDLLSFNNATLNLNTMFSTDFPIVNLTSTTINGPAAFTNSSDSSLTLVESTFNAPVVNNGMIQQEGINTNRANAMNGGLTNNAGAEILIKSTNTSPGHRTSKLNVDGNIDNHGTLAFQSRRYSSGYQGDSFLVQNNGTLTNYSGGLIQTRDPAAGTPGVNYINTDTLINNGTIENNNPSALAFDRDGASYTNNGLIDSIGSHIQFNDIGSLNNTVGGNITGSQLYVYGISNSSGAFDNAGMISLTTGGLTFLDLATINNSGTMNIAGGNVAVSNYGAFTNSGAIQSGATREISFSGGTYNHNAGATMTGGDLLSFNNATLNLNTMFSTDFPTVNLSSTTINGPAAFTNSSGSTLTLVESTFNAPVINNGMIQQEGITTFRANTMNGGLTNNVGADLLIKSTNTSPGHRTSKLNVDGNIDNHGTLAFQSRRYSPGYQGDSFLEQNNGTFTNHANGIIENRAPSGGTPGASFVRTDKLVNDGLIQNISMATWYFDRDDAVYENNGIIDAAAGSIYFDDVASFTNEASGVIITSGGNVYVDGLGFMNYGTITGNQTLVLSGGAQLINEGLISPGESPGTLSVSGDVLFSETSVLLIELGGLDQGLNYDLFAVSGSTTFDGQLDIDLYNGFIPDVNDIFTVITSTSASGWFENAATQIEFETGTFDITYTGNSVVLSNFVTAVPEPSSAILFLFGVGATVLRRRRSLATQDRQSR